MRVLQVWWRRRPVSMHAQLHPPCTGHRQQGPQPRHVCAQLSVSEWPDSFASVGFDSFIANRNHQGAGLQVINNTISGNRGRGLLIKAGNGTLQGNTIVNPAWWGIMVSNSVAGPMPLGTCAPLAWRRHLLLCCQRALLVLCATCKQGAALARHVEACGSCAQPAAACKGAGGVPAAMQWGRRRVHARR